MQEARRETLKAVMMKPIDSVAVALTDIPAGTRVRIVCQENVFEVDVVEPIEFGHKFAVRPIAAGEHILKYGEVIGKATVDIQPGQHVHVHNLEGIRGRGDQLAAKR